MTTKSRFDNALEHVAQTETRARRARAKLLVALRDHRKAIQSLELVAASAMDRRAMKTEGAIVPPECIQQAMQLRDHSSWELAIGRRKTRVASYWRRIAILALRENHMTFNEIGEVLGGRDHATISHHAARASEDEDQIAIEVITAARQIYSASSGTQSQ